MSKAAEIAASMYGIGEELEKEATELESQLVTETEEVKPFKMSDYIKPQIINEETETVEEAIEPQEQITEVEEEVIEEAEVDNDVEKQASIINTIKEKGGDAIARVVNGKPVAVLTDEVRSEFDDGRVIKTKKVQKKYKNGKVRTTKKEFDSAVHTSAKGVKDIIAKNPKKSALVLGGTAAAALAGKAIYDKQKQKKTDKVSKVANELLEEAGLTKVANEKNEKVEKIAFAILEEAGFLK